MGQGYAARLTTLAGTKCVKTSCKNNVFLTGIAVTELAPCTHLKVSASYIVSVHILRSVFVPTVGGKHNIRTWDACYLKFLIRPTTKFYGFYRELFF